MKTHDYDIIAYEVMRLEEEDIFSIAITCERKGTGKAKNIRWSSDDETVVIVDKKGVVTAVGQGSAVVTATLGKKTEHCLFYVIERRFPFIDVKEDYWYYESVDFVRKSHLMNGLNKNTFGPTVLLSRAQFSVILYCLADGPKVPYEKKYEDVPDEEWYTQPILWASKMGIANGYAGTWSTTADYLMALPARQSLVQSPGETIMFADHAGIGSDGKYTEQIDLYAPRMLVRDEDAGWDSSPTMHFRHSSKANICWADGHVTAEGPLTYTQSGWGVSEEGLRQHKIGWFGGSKENSIKLFKLKKNAN